MRFLVPRYQIFAFCRDYRVCDTIYGEFVFRPCFPTMSSNDKASTAGSSSSPFIIARRRYIVSKERRIERLPSGYSVQESRDDSEGRYWFVVTSLEVM